MTLLLFNIWWSGALVCSVGGQVVCFYHNEEAYGSGTWKYPEVLVITVLWPATFVLFFTIGFVSITNSQVLPRFRRAVGSSENSARLTRKQRRALEFERQHTALVEQRLRVQREYEAAIKVSATESIG